ncbi:hypothetical protein M408DRAFT_59453, partial [Serendipita vermifera MAFF 305830]
LGSALTVLQMAFVVISYLPSFLHRRHDASGFRSFLPTFEKPAVPLASWGVQVVVLLGVSIFNNWTFIYKIPLTLQIVFRSSGIIATDKNSLGLAVSMLFGYLFLEKRYNARQIIAVILVTVGVLVATLSRPTAANASSVHYDISTYIKGVTVMSLSLLLSGVLGTLQETTYRRYGSHWKEGVFYTHALALPVFLLVTNDALSGLKGIVRHAKGTAIPEIYGVVAVNVVTQAGCVSGANRLASSTSSVQTSLLLTVRKAISLIVSILWFGSGWNGGIVAGGLLVSVGTMLYSWPSKHEKMKTQ